MKDQEFDPSGEHDEKRLPDLFHEPEEWEEQSSVDPDTEDRDAAVDHAFSEEADDTEEGLHETVSEDVPGEDATVAFDELYTEELDAVEEESSQLDGELFTDEFHWYSGDSDPADNDEFVETMTVDEPFTEDTDTNHVNDDNVFPVVETLDLDPDAEPSTQVMMIPAARDMHDTETLPEPAPADKPLPSRRELRERERQQKKDGNIFDQLNLNNMPSQEPSTKKKWGIAAATAGVVAALGLGGWWLFQEAPWEPDTAVVPAAVTTIERGEDFDTACEPFRAEGFDNCNVELETHEEALRGTLTASNIEEGEELPLDANIRLIYSNGPETSEFPNLRNQTIENAEEILYNINVSVAEIEEIDDSGLDPGRVVSTSIEPGETVENGSEVVLQISSGTVNIPDWIGESRDLVNAEADELGLDVEFIEEESDEAPGIVLDQSPDAGPENTSQVQVTIAKSAEESLLEVPEIVGMSADEARTELAAVGFRSIHTVTVPNSEVSEAEVTQVVPNEGEETGSGSNIVVIVSEPTNND